MQTLNDLSLNDKVKFGKYKGEEIIWRIVDKNNPDYPSGVVTLMADKVLFNKAFDGEEPNNTNSDRKNYGNNRYKYSNIRQWLNKSGHPWYEPQHEYDAPPNSNNVSSNPYEDEPGFLTDFIDDEIEAIVNTPVKVIVPDVDGGGLETVTDKIFLSSRTEMGFDDEVSGKPEGTKYPAFDSDDDRRSSTYYWLRSPYSGNAYRVRHVHSDGSLNGNDARVGNRGVRPALNLSSEILTSVETDSDGAHHIIWATPHKIVLDKPITISKGGRLEKLKFGPQVNDEAMELRTTDSEKMIYDIENLDTDKVDLKIEGKNGVIDNIAYTID